MSVRIQVNDSIEVSGFRKTQGGYLVADAKIARTGIYVYHGSDLGRPELGEVKIYRPPESVFDQESMASFAHKPITNDHPPEDVTASNWKKYAVGYSGDQVVRDGEFVKVPLMVADSASVTDIENGKKELSAGYGTEIFFEDGVSPEGEAYQARMGKPIGNHIAIVQKGRAGSECRIGDSYHQAYPTKKEIEPMADTFRAVIVDSVSYQMTDQAAQVVEKLQASLRDTTGKLQAKDGEIAALKAAHLTSIQAKDGEIDALKSTHASAIQAKDGEIAAVKAQVPGPEALDAALQQRLGLFDVARRTLGDSFDAKGKSNDDIRREVVRKRLGDSALEGKPVEYVNAAFDVLSVADASSGVTPTDPIRALVMDSGIKPNGSPTGVSVAAKDADDAYEKMLKQQQNAWRYGADAAKKDAV